MSEPTQLPFDRPDAGAVGRAERFVDALAKGQPVDFGDDSNGGDSALAGLLESWRDELRTPVPDGLCPDHQALAVFNRARSARSRADRRARVVAAIAAVVVCIGGFGAMVAAAQPGDRLYGIHTMLFGEPPSVHDERIALSAETDLDLVEEMISQGQWEQAQDKLAAVSDRVRAVRDGDRKQTLIDQVNQLNAKVSNRDPNATPTASTHPG
jgi:Anti-sigma-D factor RsdA to sigma factor binding region